MEIGNIIPHIEALIFASDKPLTAIELTELANNAFGFMDEKLTLEQIQTAIDGIIEKYRSEFYPFEVRESGGGLQFLTKKDYHKTVAQLNGEKFLKRLSTAALETLSIIAYKQPVTKGEIEAIRGVSSDYAIQRLLEKELIVITGRNEKLPGHPLVYATSKSFMDYFGINSPEDLPKLKEIFDESAINPTNIDGSVGESSSEDGNAEDSSQDGDGSELLAVTQHGELTKARMRSDRRDDVSSVRQQDESDAIIDAEAAVAAVDAIEAAEGNDALEIEESAITSDSNDTAADSALAEDIPDPHVESEADDAGEDDSVDNEDPENAAAADEEDFDEEDSAAAAAAEEEEEEDLDEDEFDEDESDEDENDEDKSDADKSDEDEPGEDTNVDESYSEPADDNEQTSEDKLKDNDGDKDEDPKTDKS